METKKDEKGGGQTDLLEAIETDATGKVPGAPEAEAAADENKSDARMSADAEDGDDKDDAAPPANEDPLAQERRLRRKIQKELKREARAKERNELAELRRITAEQAERLRQIEQTQNGTTETTLQSNLRNAVHVYEQATEDLRLAVEAGDGKRHIEALERRDRAKETAQAIDVQLRRLKAAEAERSRPVGVDPNEARLYQEWVSNNSWFDASLSDEKSQMARVVNDALLTEGYRPNTPAFWNELSNRVERFTKGTKPNKRADADDGDDPPPARRGGPPTAGSGREGGASSNSNKVYISPERKQAMMEAGAWNDEALRQKYLRAYAKFDRENPQRAN